MKLKDQAKEQNIKEATFKLVSRKGIAGVTMNRVAKEAKISASMIYTYFKNKEDLLEVVFKDAVQTLSNDIKLKQQSGLPFKANLSFHFKQFLIVKRSKSMEYSFFKNFLQSPYFKERHRDFVLQGLGKQVFGMFIEGQEQMIVKDKVNVFLLAALLDGYTEKLVEMSGHGLFQLDEKNTNDAFTIFWDGIRQ